MLPGDVKNPRATTSTMSLIRPPRTPNHSTEKHCRDGPCLESRCSFDDFTTLLLSAFILTPDLFFTLDRQSSIALIHTCFACFYFLCSTFILKQASFLPSFSLFLTFTCTISPASPVLVWHSGFWREVQHMLLSYAFRGELCNTASAYFVPSCLGFFRPIMRLWSYLAHCAQEEVPECVDGEST